MTETVLVVGAGPTGLALATELRRNGISCRIIDRAASRPANQARALTMWDGAFDVLRRQGTAERIRAHGIPMTAARYFSRGKSVADVEFGPGSGNEAAPVIITQPAVESVMIDHLGGLGVAVEWRTALASLDDRGDAVDVVLDHDGRTEELTVSWVVGCDGAHSTVREAAGIAFEGSTYGRRFALGDGAITAPVPPGEAHYHLHPDGVLVVVPLPDGQVRVFADVSTTDSTSEALSVAELQAIADARAPYPIEIAELGWSTKFLVHMGQAVRYRRGRCLLAGDAAHLHSPAGGQGLNTGIQDAASLGWRLATVIAGCTGAEALLDSYESERSPIAREVVQAADRQTKLWTVRSPVGRFARDLVLSGLSRSGLLEKRLVPTLAQHDLDYRSSPVVSEHGGRRALGRALPEVALIEAHDEAVELRALLDGPDHVVVVLLDCDTVAGESARVRDIPRRIAEYGAGLRIVAIVSGGRVVEDLGVVETFRAPDGYAPEQELVGSRLVLIRPDGYTVAAARDLDVTALLARCPALPSAVASDRVAGSAGHEPPVPGVRPE
ncbi:FAD-dependent monooxygenase [Nocardia cyriacigeorgica]|uniref:FAD-dependent monooxygenase n=1 Tax=Nocardia cyriacigeorgica TaxID=135487 RepID=UPI002456C1FA|nr:FAD-dependent monooxygenase [Nocardia cyriacigeorgica]